MLYSYQTLPFILVYSLVTKQITYCVCQEHMNLLQSYQTMTSVG